MPQFAALPTSCPAERYISGVATNGLFCNAKTIDTVNTAMMKFITIRATFVLRSRSLMAFQTTKAENADISQVQNSSEPSRPAQTPASL